jgi:hemerythrin superfamily protein
MATMNAVGESWNDGLRMQMRGEERRIESQHEHLDSLCQELYWRIDKDGPTYAIGEFLLFITALDAHMTMEEDVFFPALYGLRADLGSDFEALIKEHGEFRVAAAEIKEKLRANDRDGARVALDLLARRISEHERIEEDLLARITEGPMG